MRSCEGTKGRESVFELPLSKRGDEVQTAVDSVVLDVLPVQAALVPEVLLELLVDIVCDRPPAANENNHVFLSVCCLRFRPS